MINCQDFTSLMISSLIFRKNGCSHSCLKFCVAYFVSQSPFLLHLFFHDVYLLKLLMQLGRFVFTFFVAAKNLSIVSDLALVRRTVSDLSFFVSDSSESLGGDDSAVTITHHALPSSLNGGLVNNAVRYYPRAHVNHLPVDDHLSSQPGVVIEHLGPGSALDLVKSSKDNPLNETIMSNDSRTTLIGSKLNGDLPTHVVTHQ